MPSKTFLDLGKIGVVKDVASQELPINAWSDAMNMRFRNGGIERMKGEQQVFATPTVTPYWLQPYYQGGKRYWIHAGLAKISADDGTTRTDITPTPAPSGAIDDRYTGGVLNGVLVVNNGVQTPWYWGGTGVLTVLPNWPANMKAASVRPFKNVLVALDVTKGATPKRYAQMVKWSHTADPGTVPQSWDETDKTKLAGELELAEEPSLLIDQLPLGDVNIIYKENSMYAMRATGGLDVFSFQRLPGSVGAMARGCIAQTPLGHVVLTHGDVILHAGQGPRSIINGTLRKWLFMNIDSTNRNRAFLTTNPPYKEVWVCFPELGADSCTLAAVWNWDENTWTIRQLRNVTYGAVGQLDTVTTSTWDSQNYAWDDAVQAWSEDELSPAQERLLIASTQPMINAVDITGTINGTRYTSVAERTGLALDTTEMVKLIRNLRFRATGPQGVQLQIELGAQMSPEMPVQWSPAVVHTIGANPYGQVDSFATGRYLAIRVTSLDNQPWRFQSFDADFVVQGRY
ncbi:hypothetical protein Daci_1953 [Delftia acidovorans SPH-1]|uniref:Uncharacterized protein n=1 Tax=Delftia acidovorans (strain DSM 14801 / SPH-1) TaxID=398578 RepID=A9BYQ0_DELAS|nr:hypothetical protein [Delftia acidovorans]ABX34593.1 hypothetical protein Daci_1953 [Delftia acidovorans SPH-1]QPS76038.1 hypothetical protein I6G48_05640 [Delftia acidovorans]